MNRERFEMLERFLTEYYTWDGLTLYSKSSGRNIQFRTNGSRRHPYFTLASRKVHPRPQKYPVHEIVGYYKFGHALIDMTVDHIDNNPMNFNSDNLQLMTLRDNVKKQGNSYIKLNESQVRDIKRRLRAGETQESIANIYNVGRPLISKIKLGTRWQEVME